MSKHAWNTFRQSGKRTRKGNNRDGDADDPDRLAGEHFLYSLAGNSQLPRDLGLGEAFGDEAAEDVTALGVQLLRQARVPDGLVADFPQPLESLLVRRDAGLPLCHEAIMTTKGCHVKQGLSPRPAPIRHQGHALPAPPGTPPLRRALSANMPQAAFGRHGIRGTGNENLEPFTWRTATTPVDTTTVGCHNGGMDAKEQAHKDLFARLRQP
jgi:hypothetical protein